MEPLKNAVSSGQTSWSRPAFTMGKDCTSIKILSISSQLLSSVTVKT